MASVQAQQKWRHKNKFVKRQLNIMARKIFMNISKKSRIRTILKEGEAVAFAVFVTKALIQQGDFNDEADHFHESLLRAITAIETFMPLIRSARPNSYCRMQKAIDTLIRKVAREEILSRYQSLQDHEISGKQSGEIVTEADLHSERRLSRDLTALLPGSEVIGEEAYEADPEIISRFKEEAPVWVLDPLDGTRNYSEGRPCFCVIVALVDQQITQAGWIFDLKNIMYSARRERALSGTRARNLSRQKISNMVGSVGKMRREKIDIQHGPAGITGR